MSAQWAVLQFPGSNSDHDALKALQPFKDVSVRFHWHEDPIELGQYQLLILPGGFSYGDYLRAGAIARHAPSMRNLSEVIHAGCHVMGICNGFQILLEARLLPGFLQVNETLRFISRTVSCEFKEAAYPWIRKDQVGKKLKLPIAHRFGNYQVSRVDRSEVQAALCYEENVNGSFNSIAGIYRSMGKGSVFGLMPHPERACHPALPVTDGAEFFKNAHRHLIRGEGS